MIIDTHCHVGLYKYEPVPSLLYHMERSGVDKAVFIQYMGNTDNGYMVNCMQSHPGRFAAAMIVPVDDDGSAIRAWAERGIVGIRLPADFRGAGAEPLAHWRTAAELGLVVSAPSQPATLLGAEFREVVETFPDLSIVIEHLGGIGRGSQPPHTTFQQVLELAQFPNLTIKLPGFGEFCDLTQIFHAAAAESVDMLQQHLRDHSEAVFSAIPPLADMTLEAFGPQRMMWGSDYPPVSTREGYELSLRLPMAYFSSLSEEERAWIFGRTAQRVWRLDD
jgi:L-fuconolactonase